MRTLHTGQPQGKWALTGLSLICLFVEILHCSLLTPFVDNSEVQRKQPRVCVCEGMSLGFLDVFVACG